jgi:hypothetical protein
MADTSRKIIDEYKKDAAKCIKQIESCNFECTGGTLENNVAWIALKEILQEGK